MSARMRVHLGTSNGS
ncbi:hypothetical protein MTR67_030253 [Solanum verrucosum]|uniref:Uncharacterized protein n=1 Tax=Solanum verrucosum TaxID=315347 RepID=A0AAF0R8Z6_SOLVR|nr:hypothetical protein MTR67_030253 [Solanum verrucosum]